MNDLERLDPERQSQARAQLADAFTESTWLDPKIRVLALKELEKGADERVAQTISCLLGQIRLHEGIGEPIEVLRTAFERTAALANRQTAAIFEQQLMSALIARIQRGGPAH
jgi:hypothetical protein